MRTITFDRFDLGIDVRKGPSVSDANRLREMFNACVTTGLAVQKRPGLVKVATLEAGTKGLFAAGGQFHTFYGQGEVQHADTRFKAHKVAHPDGERPLADVHFADGFNQGIYVAVEYQDGTLKHHWLNGETSSAITDAHCPHSAAVVKAGSRFFAVAGDVARYCTLERPRIWSRCPESEKGPNGTPKDKDKWGADDAGFLPVGQHFNGERSANALGIYRNQLVVLARDGAQVWSIDPDPSAMRLTDRVDNVGTHYPRTLATVAGDLYFLADAGFRSITTLQYTNTPADVDIGSPIDPLVRDALKPFSAALNSPQAPQATVKPRACYYAGSGQYLCAVGPDIFVYSVSRTAKLAAWSRYRFPFPVDAFAERGGVLHIRHQDTIYRFSGEEQTDDGAPFEVVLEGPYLDLKAPGEMKRLIGAQIIAEGDYTFSVAFDERHPRLATAPVRLRGTTRGGGRIPLHCRGAAFALRFKSRSRQPFRLDAATLYYD